ncbi:MAG: Lrp/AsnC family transcriptional regulator [Candidatus Aenigmarchaeota archaeon]|nr:Lrp/AsnC family transcriptional regulator [Candidatus Aenigmarchaeota archaeon]MDI6721925.1 Lrp/AsnC family transcriptional regulator [Candidatus Aenigmarchaeota archaeon]
MDELDKKIANLLMENSKLSYRKIARNLSTSTATIMNRVNRLEKEGIIKKYTAKLDYERLGYDVSVIVDVRVSKGKLLEVEKKIASHPNVSAVYDITGHFDAMVIANFRSRKELDVFLKRLQALEFVERTETKLILNKVKEEFMKIM